MRSAHHVAPPPSPPHPQVSSLTSLCDEERSRSSAGRGERDAFWKAELTAKSGALAEVEHRCVRVCVYGRIIGV